MASGAQHTYDEQEMIIYGMQRAQKLRRMSTSVEPAPEIRRTRSYENCIKVLEQNIKKAHVRFLDAIHEINALPLKSRKEVLTEIRSVVGGSIKHHLAMSQVDARDQVFINTVAMYLNLVSQEDDIKFTSRAAVESKQGVLNLSADKPDYLLSRLKKSREFKQYFDDTRSVYKGSGPVTSQESLIETEAAGKGRGKKPAGKTKFKPKTSVVRRSSATSSAVRSERSIESRASSSLAEELLKRKSMAVPLERMPRPGEDEAVAEDRRYEEENRLRRQQHDEMGEELLKDHDQMVEDGERPERYERRRRQTIAPRADQEDDGTPATGLLSPSQAREALQQQEDAAAQEQVPQNMLLPAELLPQLDPVQHLEAERAAAAAAAAVAAVTASASAAELLLADKNHDLSGLQPLTSADDRKMQEALHEVKAVPQRRHYRQQPSQDEKVLEPTPHLQVKTAPAPSVETAEMLSSVMPGISSLFQTEADRRTEAIMNDLMASADPQGRLDGRSLTPKRMRKKDDGKPVKRRISTVPSLSGQRAGLKALLAAESAPRSILATKSEEPESSGGGAGAATPSDGEVKTIASRTSTSIFDEDENEDEEVGHIPTPSEAMAKEGERAVMVEQQQREQQRQQQSHLQRPENDEDDDGTLTTVDMVGAKEDGADEAMRPPLARADQESGQDSFDSMASLSLGQRRRSRPEPIFDVRMMHSITWLHEKIRAKRRQVPKTVKEEVPKAARKEPKEKKAVGKAYSTVLLYKRGITQVELERRAAMSILVLLLAQKPLMHKRDGTAITTTLTIDNHPKSFFCYWSPLVTDTITFKRKLKKETQKELQRQLMCVRKEAALDGGAAKLQMLRRKIEVIKSYVPAMYDLRDNMAAIYEQPLMSRTSLTDACYYSKFVL